VRIEDCRVTIEDATPVWGQGIFDTEEWLEQTVGYGTKTLSIGPAAENLVPYACVGSDSYRQMGRGGVGTLFGSKKLKGIACKGTGGVQVFEIGMYMDKVATAMSSNLMTADNMWAKDVGTPMLVDVTNEMGIHPTRNFTSGINPKKHSLDSEAINDVKIGDRACASCPLGCGNFTSVNGIQVEGPEYETIALGGSNCDINDMEQVMRFNKVCDDLGLDTMSTGGVLAMAMEMTEEGVHDFGLRFGDAKEAMQVIEEIASMSTERGRDLAMGVARLGQKYQAEDLAAHGKGLEMPAYDPRGNYGMGLAFATSERGACHLRAFPLLAQDPFHIKSMVREVIEQHNQNAAKWSMCLCDFWGTVDLESMAGMLTEGLGRKISAEDLRKAGERIWNMIRMYNYRAGFTAEHDVLSDKVAKKSLKSGPNAGRTFSPETLQEMKDLYYRLRQWDETGWPLEEKVRRLGLKPLVHA
jgi:aldehyde:ferredoxin oxidoreductase